MAALEYTELVDVGNDILTCKLLWAHRWDRNPSPRNIRGEVARMAYRILCLRCSRCRRERYDYIDTHGGLIGRYYVNPVNYPRTRRHNGDELRAEAIARELMVQTWAGED